MRDSLQDPHERDVGPPPDAARTDSSLQLGDGGAHTPVAHLTEGVAIGELTFRNVVTERRRAAALLELGDRLRQLADPDDMAFAAAEIMGHALGLVRAGYGGVDMARESVVIARDWTAPGIASIAGRHRFSGFSADFGGLRRGETFVVADVTQDARTADAAAMWLALGVRSVVNLPVIERDALVALFFLHDGAARDWSAADIAFLRDVADRTRAAIERRRAEADLRALATTLERQVAERTADRNRMWLLSTDIMVVCDPDLVLLAVNPAWSVVLGWTEAELLGIPAFDLIHPDDVAATQTVRRRVAEGDTLRWFENRLRHKQGHYRWISWTAVPGEGLINAVGRDITDEKARAEALKVSEARLRSVFDSLYRFQCLLAVDGTLLDANRASFAVIGERFDDVVGRKFWDTPWFAATPDIADLIASAVPRVAAGETFRQEIALNLPVAGQRVFDFSLRPVHDAAGVVIGLVPEAMDITERRTAEEQLRQAQKMEAVGQLTGGIAHDFNNLLAGIAGSLELLQRRIGQGRLDDARRYIDTATRAAHRAAALTHRLLAFSRQQTLAPRPTPADALIAGMRDLIERTVGPRITLAVMPTVDLWPTLCDPHQLENALLNLCINARDAMPDGGRLSIETANVSLDAADAAARDVPPGDYATIAVTDTGIGMPPEVAARAFEPFFTTKPQGQGTGLGLSMIQSFVCQSGGHVRIRSQPGAGTTVRLYLLRHEGDAAAEAAPAAPGATLQARDGETVLVVDDEATVRMLLAEALSDLGYVVITAADAAEALPVLRSGRRIDLLVTDIGLPGAFNGRQLADLAGQMRSALKVLFITGYTETSVIGHNRLTPDMRLMTKPFTLDVLAEQVTEMLRS
jgi:PAS domain S-box-containing protein